MKTSAFAVSRSENSRRRTASPKGPTRTKGSWGSVQKGELTVLWYFVGAGAESMLALSAGELNCSPEADPKAAGDVIMSVRGRSRCGKAARTTPDNRLATSWVPAVFPSTAVVPWTLLRNC